jgi:hypothetical protein
MKKVAFRFVLALAAVALALPMMAKSPDTASKPKSTTLTLDTPVQFGTTMVKPGTYKLVIENDKATIESGKTVIATAPGHWQEGKQKAESTGYDSTNGRVDDIFVHGESGVFVLGSAAAAK